MTKWKSVALAVSAAFDRLLSIFRGYLIYGFPIHPEFDRTKGIVLVLKLNDKDQEYGHKAWTYWYEDGSCIIEMPPHNGKVTKDWLALLGHEVMHGFYGQYH